MPILVIDNLRKRLGKNDILRGLNLTVEEGEIIALLGPSGSGKTTLLRCISGLEEPDSGSIKLRDKAFFDGAAGVHLPTEQRNLGLVFQSYALWPHRSVADNVSFGLEMRRMPGDQIRKKVQDSLTSLGLSTMATRYPSELSGGQQQRVALARAFVTEPDILLLDEPLSNLDAKLREYARVWLRDELKAAGKTAIFVTHDQAEAMAVADRIAILAAGQLEQIGTPQEIYDDPRTLLVADFMGSPNLLKGQVRHVTDDGQYIVNVAGFDLVGRSPDKLPVGSVCRVVMRPEQLQLAEPGQPNSLRAKLLRSLFFGTHWEHWVEIGDAEARFNAPHALPDGDVTLALPAHRTLIFADQSVPDSKDTADLAALHHQKTETSYA